MQYELLDKRVSAHKSNTLRFYSGKHFVFVCTYVRLCIAQHRTHMVHILYMCAHCPFTRCVFKCLIMHFA